MREEVLYKRYLFPFEDVEQGSDIVLWGGGILAREYIRQNNERNWCRIKYLVDSNWEQMRGMFVPLEVFSPQKLLTDKEVKVVISVTDSRGAAKIKEQLKELGVNPDKTVWNIKLSSDHWGVASWQRFFFDSEREMRDYFSDYYVDFLKKIHELLTIKRVTNKKMIRVGRDNDGGYAMLNDFEKDECIAYSFGIAEDVSWDKQMAEMGYEVFMYDHTINRLSEDHKGFHFFKKGIADSENHSDEVEELSELMKKNGHELKHHMILKMDVEGCEYGFLRMVESSVLDQFDQIVMELHGLTTKREGVIEALEKLTTTHQIIHVHANNYGSVLWAGNVPYPETYEVTLANRNVYEFKETRGEIALEHVDMPCNPKDLEIGLGNWNVD